MPELGLLTEKDEKALVDYHVVAQHIGGVKFLILNEPSDYQDIADRNSEGV